MTFRGNIVAAKQTYAQSWYSIDKDNNNQLS